jgi:DNA ligase-1
MYSSKSIVSTKEEFIKFFQNAKTLNLEGVMIKGIESKYESGKRGIQWLKYKETLDPLDVVVLSAEYGEGKNSRYLSNLTFGVWNEDKSHAIPVGRVYSGLTEDKLKELTPRFNNLQTEKIQNGVKVKPEIILEVGFENIQESERYSSGYAVRFPRVLRERTGDKPLDEINTIKDVEEMFKKLNK